MLRLGLYNFESNCNCSYVYTITIMQLIKCFIFQGSLHISSTFQQIPSSEDIISHPITCLLICSTKLRTAH